MKNLFSAEEEERILEAIRRAENQTSGEIRVHLDGHRGGEVMALAQKTFKRLKMHQTEARNGVLIFIAPRIRQFAILGDEGIDAVVPEDFWDEERDILQAHFRQEAFAEGICRVVEQIGAKLKKHFPYRDDDENELSDEISYG